MQRILPNLIMILFIFWGCSSKTNLHQVSSKENTQKIQTIIQEDIDVNQRGEFSLTPLMTAAKSNNFRLIRTLLANGADIDAKDDFRKSAIWYAYDYESFDAFKILLENGAVIDFPLNYDNAPTLYKKKNLYKIAKEYSLLKKIRDNSNDHVIFNAYFSEFSDGYYLSEIEKIFEDIVEKDYHAIESSSSAVELQKFLNKYSGLGKKYYVVTVDTLNIRISDSTDAEKTGMYLKGDKLYAVTEKTGWIQTDRGWVSKTYIKPITKRIPILSKYIEKAEDKLSKLRKTKTEKPEYIKPENTKIEVRQQVSESGIEQAEKELDNLLQDAELSKLEEFINRYKDAPEYRNVVERAKITYRKILLHE